MKRPGQYFRAGVGAVIINEAGHVLVLERSDIEGAWQFPQGGLEKGEEPSRAVVREVNEETGIASHHLELVEKYPEPLAYELPPAARNKKMGRGQVQYWFLFKFLGTNSDIALRNSAEFNTWRWMPMDDLIDCVVKFRAGLYRRLADYFSDHLK